MNLFAAAIMLAFMTFTPDEDYEKSELNKHKLSYIKPEKKSRKEIRREKREKYITLKYDKSN